MRALLAFLPGGGWLQLLLGPVGKWCLIGLAVVAIFAEVDHRGYARASARCQTASLEAKVKALTIDKEAADAVAKRAATDAARSADIAAKNSAILEEFRRAPKSAACLLTADDARRLRGLH